MSFLFGGKARREREQLASTQAKVQALESHLGTLRALEAQAEAQAAAEDEEHDLRETNEVEALQAESEVAFQEEVEEAAIQEREHQEQRDAATSELNLERRHSATALRLLAGWHSEAEGLLASMRPRRPQLLLELWTVEGFPALSALLGEQWVPYHAARGAASAEDAAWELPLVERLCLSREAVGKPSAFAPLQQVPAGTRPHSAASMQWTVRLQATWALEEARRAAPARPEEQAEQVEPARPSESVLPGGDLLEHFHFQLEDLEATSVEDNPVTSDRAQLPRDIIAQLWCWGGSSLMPSGPKLCTAAWAKIFESTPVAMELSDGGSWIGAFDGAQQFDLRLQPCSIAGIGPRDEPLELDVMAAGGGIDALGDAELSGMRESLKQEEAACERLAARAAELSGAAGGPSAASSGVGGAAEVEALEAQCNSLGAEVEALRQECQEEARQQPTPKAPPRRSVWQRPRQEPSEDSPPQLRGRATVRTPQETPSEDTPPQLRGRATVKPPQELPEDSPPQLRGRATVRPPQVPPVPLASALRRTIAR